MHISGLRNSRFQAVTEWSNIIEKVLYEEGSRGATRELENGTWGRPVLIFQWFILSQD